MFRRSSPTLLFATLLIAATAVHANDISTNAVPTVIVDTSGQPVAPGKFQPTWESLEQYRAPEWYRDAKFGLWAHWGPQCEPEAGDWYARGMYEEGSGQYRKHLDKYGHPSKSGFMEVIRQWKAERWDPDKIVALYKRVGAQFFVAMANHHDNLDLWDSKYHAWNSVAVGPKKNIIAGWAKAARAQGLPFGLTVHSAHAWMFYEPAQGADRSGPLEGKPYDGNLTKADGKGKWWEGLDPQELYAQKHPRGPGKGGDAWNWGGHPESRPDLKYCQNFYDRTMDLINKYHPDLLYFDDSVLPLWPVSDVGLKIAAHYYNDSLRRHGGKLEAVLLGKMLDERQRKTMVWDIERGQSDRIEPYVWQTDTCIGGWHYDRERYKKGGYKSAREVIHTLADIVSKNGNLMLSVPVRGDGTLDEKEIAILEEIGGWMDVNRESIFGTRPWRVFGEGPAQRNRPELQAAGFNENKVAFSNSDIRFTQKGGALYAIVLGWPNKPLAITALGTSSEGGAKPVRQVALLGSKDKVRWKQDANALVIEPVAAPKGAPAIAAVFRISP